MTNGKAMGLVNPMGGVAGRTIAYSTQDEVLTRLRNLGYPISRYTLEYWREEGSIPQLTRLGKQYYYSEADIAIIVEKCRTVGRVFPKQILFTLNLEGDIFNIVEVNVKRDGNKVNTVLTIDDGSILLEREDLREWLRQHRRDALQ